MDLRLRNKTLLVTAASRGLGFGVAKALVQEEANVIICSRNEDSLQNAISGIMTLLTQEEIMRLVSEVAVATVEGTKKTAKGFMDSILNRFRPEDQD